MARKKRSSASRGQPSTAQPTPSGQPSAEATAETSIKADCESLIKSKNEKSKENEVVNIEENKNQEKWIEEIDAEAMTMEDLEVKLDSLVRERNERIKLYFGSNNGNGERRESADHLNKLALSTDSHKIPMVAIKDYWKKMSAKQKRGLLKVKINELKEHVCLFNGILFQKDFMEALHWAKEVDNSKIWFCLVCGNRMFVSQGIWRDHILLETVGGLEPQLARILPIKEDVKNLIKTMEQGSWKPVDRVAASNIIENRPRFDVLDSENHEWPVCDDRKRAELIELIRIRLQFLESKNSFSRSHIQEMMNYTISSMNNFLTESKVKECGLDRTLHSICFLEVPHLNRFLVFLEGLDKSRASVDFEDDLSELQVDPVCDIKERVTFSPDLSCLLLDERLLSGDLFANTCNTTVEDGRSGIVSTDGDSFINWLFEDFTVMKHPPNPLTIVTKARRDRGLLIFKICCMNFQILKILLMMKAKTIGAFRDVDSREEISDAIKKQRKEELSMELHNLDAKIITCLNADRLTMQKFALFSAYDYQLIILHLLKSFIQAHLEDLVNMEALLAELAIDHNHSKSRDSVSQMQGKQKNKNKNKRHKKAKHSKSKFGGELKLPIHDENAEQVCPIPCDVDQHIETGEQFQQESLLFEHENLEDCIDTSISGEDNSKVKVDAGIEDFGYSHDQGSLDQATSGDSALPYDIQLGIQGNSENNYFNSLEQHIKSVVDWKRKAQDLSSLFV